MSVSQKKLDACSHFISSCPSGEVRAMLKELATLFPSITSEDCKDFLAKEMQKYNEAQYLVLDSTIICPESRVDSTSNQYINPRSKKTITIDHVEQKVLESTSEVTTSDASVYTDSELYKNLDEAIETYVSKQFAIGIEKTAQANSCVVAQKNSSKEYTVIISGVNRRFAALWGGSWKSRFTLAFDDTDSPTSATLSGKVLLNAHYFEKGTIQLNKISEMESCTINTANSSGKDELMKLVVERIRDFEAGVQMKMLMAHGYMDSQIMKDLRRISAVTGEPFNWTGNTMKVAQSMGKGSK
eukprot:g821.t1